MGLTPPPGAVGKACRRALSPPVVRASMMRFLLLVRPDGCEKCFRSHGAVKNLRSENVPYCSHDHTQLCCTQSDRFYRWSRVLNMG